MDNISLLQHIKEILQHENRITQALCPTCSARGRQRLLEKNELKCGRKKQRKRTGRHFRSYSYYQKLSCFRQLVISMLFATCHRQLRLLCLDIQELFGLLEIGLSKIVRLEKLNGPLIWVPFYISHGQFSDNTIYQRLGA